MNDLEQCAKRLIEGMAKMLEDDTSVMEFVTEILVELRAVELGERTRCAAKCEAFRKKANGTTARNTEAACRKCRDAILGMN